MRTYPAALTSIALVLVARGAAAQSCMSAEECPRDTDCIRGVCQAVAPQPAPPASPPPGAVYVAPGPGYPPGGVYAPGPVPPRRFHERVSVRERGAHFEFGLHIAGIWVPPDTSAFYPNITLGVRSRAVDFHVIVGYLHTHSHSTDGDGGVFGIDPRFWFGPYGVGFTLGVATMNFSPNTSSGWRGFSTGIVALVTPVSLQFGQGHVRFETSIRFGLYYFPDRSGSSAAAPFGLLSIGLVFG